jgi:predicted DNA binding CopG/RHH family protein
MRLNKEEREIERSAETFKPVSKKEKARIEGLLQDMKKNRSISIRISNTVLEQVKQHASEEGIPYQTLISSILHKYVNHKLVDEAAIRKTVHLLRD